ncbi:MAG TPA: cytochrome c maturation protein CcmE [Gaiellaceae bacterium]|nr:cytochrome c maturation protein CcmE [Gaiellaceae bacterium]
MAKRRSPARLVVALSIAAVLAVFLLYTSFAGGATPSLRPSQLADHPGDVSLAGRVVGPVDGDARGDGLRFTLRDIDGTATVPVVYTGSVPDLFEVGRHVYMRGELRGGVFVAEQDSLVTKCPSKYEPKED